MIEYPYLIAIALIEQENYRLMPLGGKSLPKKICSIDHVKKMGEPLVTQLLIRVFQQSSEAPIKSAFKEESLLLIQIPMNVMQEKIPLLKAKWIKNGDNSIFFSELKQICQDVWSVRFSKEKGIYISSLK